MKNGRYVVVTPVRDEAAHIERTIQSMTAQVWPPVRWVVVDDGSTDETGAVLDSYAARIPWMSVVHRPNRGHRANGGGVMEAFYAGFALLNDLQWDYLVKLDGDLSFNTEYFAACISVFENDPKLGIGGGTIRRSDNLDVDSKGDPPFHVRGATKIYRRQCWERISPLVIAPGWDTIDEVKANHFGWTTRTFADLTLIQHKPTGGADGTWRNHFKNGRANYVTGYHPAFMIAKCLRRAVRRPVLIGSIALLSGFLSGYLKRIPRGADDRVIRYLREQQVRRLFNRPSIYA